MLKKKATDLTYFLSVFLILWLLLFIFQYTLAPNLFYYSLFEECNLGAVVNIFSENLNLSKSVFVAGDQNLSRVLFYLMVLPIIWVFGSGVLLLKLTMTFISLITLLIWLQIFTDQKISRIFAERKITSVEFWKNNLRFLFFFAFYLFLPSTIASEITTAHFQFPVLFFFFSLGVLKIRQLQISQATQKTIVIFIIAAIFFTAIHIFFIAFLPVLFLQLWKLRKSMNIRKITPYLSILIAILFFLGLFWFLNKTFKTAIWELHIPRESVLELFTKLADDLRLSYSLSLLTLFCFFSGLIISVTNLFRKNIQPLSEKLSIIFITLFFVGFLIQSNYLSLALGYFLAVFLLGDFLSNLKFAKRMKMTLQMIVAALPLILFILSAKFNLINGLGTTAKTSICFQEVGVQLANIKLKKKLPEIITSCRLFNQREAVLECVYGAMIFSELGHFDSLWDGKQRLGLQVDELQAFSMGLGASMARKYDSNIETIKIARQEGNLIQTWYQAGFFKECLQNAQRFVTILPFEKKTEIPQRQSQTYYTITVNPDCKVNPPGWSFYNARYFDKINPGFIMSKTDFLKITSASGASCPNTLNQCLLPSPFSP